MKILSTTTKIINVAFTYVINKSKMDNIDESHALKHSMQTFNFANHLINKEVDMHPYLKEQQNIIYASSILHDMCDNKYVDEKNSMNELMIYMKPYMIPEELNIMKNIISTMSYSKVQTIGFPILNEYQHAYHIVRESDLLAAYDIDRCIIYNMMQKDRTYIESMPDVIKLIEDRVLNYIKDRLFITSSGNKLAENLHNQCVLDLQNLYKFNML